VGDTITLANNPAKEALPGYRKLNPMVFCGLYPIDSSKYNDLLLRNPKGQALYHNEINSQNLSFKQKVLNNAVYYKFCRAAGYKFGKIFKENKNKLFLIFALGIGEYMWQKEKNKK